MGTRRSYRAVERPVPAPARNCPMSAAGHADRVGTRTRPVDQGSERARTTLAALGRELRETRRDRGLSIAEVAFADGISVAQVSRIERGLHERVSVWHLTRLSAVVGLDLSIRLFPGGQPIRDAAHVALTRRFRAGLHRGVRWNSEVPLPIPGDRRAWDGVISADRWRYGVEVETACRDVQALLRRIGLKVRDSRVDGAILVLPANRRTRQLIGETSDVLAGAFPLDGRRALELLAAGLDPGGSAFVVV
jgi:transcriptional regulator with XRE-family HTH domain